MKHGHDNKRQKPIDEQKTEELLFLFVHRLLISIDINLVCISSHSCNNKYSTVKLNDVSNTTCMNVKCMYE